MPASAQAAGALPIRKAEQRQSLARKHRLGTRFA
jgi:hypothetical protein